jgi:murein DD-endopeptidase MepM/ murein hydrolase activator NlpD
VARRLLSVTVKVGYTVEAGQIIAACGNSGSSSEPHVHFQLMDHRHPTFAAGLPFTFTNVEVESRPGEAAPANAEFFHAASADSTVHRASRDPLPQR